jgi:hypothetical protein
MSDPVADINTVLTDPDFHALPDIERLKVLYHLDPEYRRLHPSERWKVIKLAPLTPTPPPSPPEGVISSGFE